MRPDRRSVRAVFAFLAFAAALPGGWSGCAAPGYEPRPGAGQEPAAFRAGTRVVAVEFVNAWENDAFQPYYPLESLSACEYAHDGTLIFCDELRGKVYGLDPATQRWFEFDTPYATSFQPVDVRVDGFRVLVLDRGGGAIHHLDLSGAYREELLDVRQLDPGAVVQPTAFDVDRDGRLVIADAGQQEVLLVDSFLALHSRLGGPGPREDQFLDPQGIVFRVDGSFVVADRGGGRLARYGRSGFFEGSIGGASDARSLLSTPQGLDLDRYGNLFVADPAASVIHVFDAALRPLLTLGPDFKPEGTPLGPVDVAVGPDGQLAVTDRARSAILVYRIVYE